MSRSLTINNINPHVKAAKYAVRGELATRAEQYRTQKGLPFDTVISANIGNPQQLDQKPITFFRQVLSILEYPGLLEAGIFKQDVIDRARWLLKEVHSIGAYSVSQGVPGIRQSVAKFIEQRDGYPADPNDVFLTAGASAGVNTLMHVICASPETGVLVPIPQYPLYTATLSLLDAKCVPYYLDESSAWGTDVGVMKDALKKARDEGTDVRALAVINPGNPTGGCLSAENIRSVLDFAREEKLVVMADEVYQTNVFRGEFVSFKKVLRDAKYDDLELVSFHSTSKGMVGECGHRGGYFELIGFDPEVVAQITKFVSISLCAPVVGQCLVELMVNPPKQGDPSYSQYKEEYDGIFKGLQERASALYEAFSQMEGVECQDPQVRQIACHNSCSHANEPGLHVPLPDNSSSAKSNRASQERGSGTRRVLLLPPPGRNGRLCGTGLWVRPERGHASFPHDIPGTRDRLGWTNNEVPRRIHERV